MFYISGEAAVLLKLFLDIRYIASHKHHAATSVSAGLDDKSQRRLIENILKHTLHSICNEESLSIEIENKDTAIFQSRFCLGETLFGIYIVIQPGIGH